MTTRRPNQTGPTVIDVFAGCGGMTQGFHDEGFRTELAVEWEPHAAATFAQNFDSDVICGDIATVADDRVPEVDVVVGGPPCQGFSGLGARDPLDPRNRLWREYVRVLDAAWPKVFVIENVDRFRTSAEFAMLQDTVRAGRFSEYEIRSTVLNAADYGVPQKRRRTIVIGSRVGPVELPDPTHSAEGGVDLEPWRSVRQALAERDAVPWNTMTTNLPSGSTVTFVDADGREFTVPGPFKGSDLHIGRRPTERSLERYAYIRPGHGRFDLPEELLSLCWQRKRTGTTDVFGRLEWDKPSLTIRTEFFKPEKGRYLHPQWIADRSDLQVNRPITHLEAARLQSFPPHFEWCGTKISIARQIGNAVPPLLARAVARAVLSVLV